MSISLSFSPSPGSSVQLAQSAVAGRDAFSVPPPPAPTPPPAPAPPDGWPGACRPPRPGTRNRAYGGRRLSALAPEASAVCPGGFGRGPRRLRPWPRRAFGRGFDHRGYGRGSSAAGGLLGPPGLVVKPDPPGGWGDGRLASSPRQAKLAGPMETKSTPIGTTVRSAWDFRCGGVPAFVVLRGRAAAPGAVRR